jgi:hypothetical protein
MRKLESRGRAGRFCPKIALVTVARTFGHSRPMMVGGKQFVAIAIGPNILCFGLPADCEKK